MYTFLTLSRGATVETARIIAVTFDQSLVRAVASGILSQPHVQPSGDPILAALDEGRIATLRLLADTG